MLVSEYLHNQICKAREKQDFRIGEFEFELSNESLAQLCNEKDIQNKGLNVDVDCYRYKGVKINVIG